MIYKDIILGIFLERPNRFIAKVQVNGQVELAHVKNTGRCNELLVPGARVYLEKAANINRKTKFSLISVYKGDTLINMDSQVPNAVVYDALEAGEIHEVGKVRSVRREVTYGDSRFDLYYEKDGDIKGFIEVKGVTLEDNGIALFPDAPTERGVKHIRGLIEAKKEGYEAWICFLVQMEGVSLFRPNRERDPALDQVLKEAVSEGIGVLVYDSVVSKNEIIIGTKLSYQL